MKYGARIPRPFSHENAADFSPGQPWSLQAWGNDFLRPLRLPGPDDLHNRFCATRQCLKIAPLTWPDSAASQKSVKATLAPLALIASDLAFNAPTVRSIRPFRTSSTLKPCFTPVKSPQGNESHPHTRRQMHAPRAVIAAKAAAA
ncbi:MAG: hypothetical protein ACJAVR_002192 [Paracoccaceae bacterium]|jgi:hypothetical protein